MEGEKKHLQLCLQRPNSFICVVPFLTEELKAVRIEFIEKVSPTVIEQLLDHLLQDKVLNSGEEEAITEAHDTRAKRARILIDSVWKKGDEASWKMITYLQQRDKMLFKELGLPTESPQGELRSCSSRCKTTPCLIPFERQRCVWLSPAASEVERQWSTTLIPCKRAFWNARKNDQKVLFFYNFMTYTF